MRRENGYRTKQRELILAYLQKNTARHLTVEDVTDALKQSGLAVGKTTVYRYMDKLADEGSVRKYFISNSKSACYEYIDSANTCRMHYHLTCTQCGALLHVDCGLMDQVAAHMDKDHGFLLDNTRTVLYGLCGVCRKKEQDVSNFEER